VGRVTSVSAGALTLSGLDLSGIMCLRLLIQGVTVTTDDSNVFLRYLIGGSEISSAYLYAWNRISNGIDDVQASASDSGIRMTATSARGVGNASTESFGGSVTVWHPTTTQHKRCAFHASWTKPDGGICQSTLGAGELDNSGAITGFKLYGSSDLTAGTIIALGVE
jgi:hypothetical protein